MTVARDIMTPAPRCVGENQTLIEAARLLATLDVGALPICGDDKRLKGILTDRDIVVKCLAEGGDPALTTAGQLAQGTLITIKADDDVQKALKTMKAYHVRRLPVIEGHDLVGIVTQADLARSLAPEDTGETVGEIST
ncbi:CBS domain-containing protein [Microbacterium caowuchunii]|uniref:CBS domain-containing protein n=1 Tax=Microbacterium caowuchunii TaxID=2614638 RepID=A0A5N0TNR7_9MICO|nr:CBS domain-containing protein [Microbacterium caowuchunii]KAA9135847.1 CBS domain-containing protein [Microbacterium caowuchunii]